MLVGNYSEIKDFLNEKAEKYNHPYFIETDPVQIPHQFTDVYDIEIAAFFAAAIAWGQRPVIIKNAQKLMALMDYAPFEFIMGYSEKDLTRFHYFKHRTFQGEDCIYFIRSLRNIYSKYTSVGSLFESLYEKKKEIFQALADFREVFFELEHSPRTEKHISNVLKGASAKRLNMFLRWMVRKDNKGVDFGLWKSIPASALYLPLDVHTGNVARKLGLLQRKQNDWKAVEEITSVLRNFDPKDPVKYDYALFGLGIFEKF